MKNLLGFLIVILIFSCQPGSKNKPASDKPEGQVQMTEVRIQVGGMHCEMCEASIEKGINELAGIAYVKATLADSTAVVRFDDTKVELATIEKAIEKRGYTVKGKL